jgi:hypothetical protein
MRLATVPVLGELMTRPSHMGMRMLWRPAFYDPSFITDRFIETKYALAAAPSAQQAVLGRCEALSRSRDFGSHRSRRFRR